MASDLFLSRELAALGNGISITCLDIGARGGIVQDLTPLARLINAVGFEPDTEECRLLNLGVSDTEHWKSIQYLPIALGCHGTRKLKLYRQRGCSSMLDADTVLAAQFMRDKYYILDQEVSVHPVPLDLAAEQYGFTDASYIKIDIQGMELDVFQSGEKLISSEIFAIRSEVSFLPVYKNQPLIWDICQHLAERDFIPVEFNELHSWRRYSMAKIPVLSKGDFPYSKGQLIHGDILFFKNVSAMPDSADDEIEKCIKGGLIAATYGFIDYSYALFSKANVARTLLEKYGIDGARFLAHVSGRMAKSHRISTFNNAINTIGRSWKLR
ncbi:MAG TPA: FkbM family methyltransferase [Thiohalobacter sp.]|nr:FkbM family methyltransferase [Thiohalobacter sp.]